MNVTKMTSDLVKIATVFAAFSCVASVANADLGNPWNSEKSATQSKFPAPAPLVMIAQNAAKSRYAPADLEQRLSAYKPTRPAQPPVAPQYFAPQRMPMQAPANAQPRPYTNGQQYAAPAGNGYGSPYPPSYGYGMQQPNNMGYPPVNMPGQFNNGSSMPFGGGNFPGGFPSGGGGFPTMGGAPFSVTPFGFF